MNAKFHNLSAIGAGFLAFSLVASGSLPSHSVPFNRPQLLAQNQYPQNLRNDYLRSCQRRASSEGLSNAQAQQLCQCTLRRFQARFTSAQFIALNRRASQTGQTPQAFTDIGVACYRELRN